MPDETPDLTYENHGSLALIRPLTDAAMEWVDENVETEGWAWIGGAFAVEPRYAGDILVGAELAGLTVQ